MADSSLLTKNVVFENGFSKTQKPDYAVVYDSKAANSYREGYSRNVSFLHFTADYVSYFLQHWIMNTIRSVALTYSFCKMICFIVRALCDV